MGGCLQRSRIAVACVATAVATLSLSATAAYADTLAGPPAHGARAWMGRPGAAGARAVVAPALSLEPFATVNPIISPWIPVSPPVQVDGTLGVDPGVWPGSGWTFTYQWLDCDPANSSSCVTIPGATAGSYTVDPLDGGSTLEVQVNADDGVGNTGSATTAPTVTVVAQPGAPVVQTDPAISASVAPGVAASASDGTWSPTPDTLTTQWLSCTVDLSACNTVGPADTSTYTPTAADAGDVLVFAVFATKNGLDSVEDYSAPSNLVAFPAPTVSVTTPVAGAIYPSNTPAVAQYACQPPAGMTLASCTATVSSGFLYVGFPAYSGPVANGAPFTNPFLGPTTLVATATDGDGRSASDTVKYTTGAGVFRPPTFVMLQLPPTVTIAAPAGGATYVQGASVPATFSCTGGGTCAATQTAASGALQSGQQVDTTVLGTHTLTVTSTNSVTTVAKTAHYTVVALSITSLAQSSARWHAGKALPGSSASSATKFTFTSSGAAEVAFAFARDLHGRLRGRRCVAAGRGHHGARCSRAIPAGAFSVSVGAGSDSIAFAGPLGGGKKLAHGAYTVTITAQALGGAPAAPLGSVVTVGTLHFTVVK